jgi:apolipoprotein N-acyltransferase
VLSFFLFGLISQLFILSWSGKYVGPLPLVLLALLQALFFIPSGLIFKYTRNIWLTSATILLMDQLRANFPFEGFGWSRIAFSQANAPYMSLVSKGGVAGLSAIVLCIAILLTRIRLYRLLLITTIVFFPFGSHSPIEGGSSLNVAAVQGNTPKIGLDFNGRAQAVLNLHLAKSAEIDRRVDLIVWPENASDIDPYLTSGVLDKLRTLIIQKQAPLMFGAVLRENNKLQNASVLMDANTTRSKYVKQHLTPFGEYIPMRAMAQRVSPFAADVSDFTPGNSYQTHEVGNTTIGPIICYEIIDDALVREAAKDSEMLIIQTNSATFSGTSESRQQLNITRIRAAEHNREVLSVSTVGISAFIDNNGRVLQESKENVPDLLYGTLQGNNEITLADKLGDLTWVFAIGLLAGIGSFRRNRSYV